MNSNSLADNIEKIINDNELKNNLITNLTKEKLDNKDEIKNLYDVMGS